MRRWLAAAGAAALAAAALGVAYAIPQEVEAPPSCPVVVAHRTGMAYAPENTVAGIATSAQIGAPSVEIDVQWSSSGFPVLMHDATVDRTTNGTGTPASLGLGALTGLRANDFAPFPGRPLWSSDPRFSGANTPYVPYGWEFMNAAADRGLDVIVDVHATPTDLGMSKLAHYINVFGWGPRTLVMGSFDQVTAMRGFEPSLRYALIEYNPATTIRRGESLEALGVEAYVVPARDVAPAAVRYWKSYGLRVLTWSSDSAAIDVPETWRRVAAAGVDEIITNDPPALIAVLADTCGGSSASASTS